MTELFKDVRRSRKAVFVDRKPFTNKEADRKTVEIDPGHPLWFPELPHEKHGRYVDEYGLDEKLVEALILEKEMAQDFEKLCQLHDPGITAKLLAGTLRKVLNYKKISYRCSEIDVYELSALVYMLEKDMVTPEASEKVVRKMIEDGDHPVVIVEEKGLFKSSGGLREKVKQVLESNTDAVDDGAVDFLVGEFMSEFNGFDPRDVRKVVKDEVGN